MLANGLESHGVLRGRTIELDSDLSVPDGTEVRVVVTVVTPHPPQEIRELPGFGALADCAAEIDEFNEWYRAERRRGWDEGHQP